MRLIGTTIFQLKFSIPILKVSWNYDRPILAILIELKKCSPNSRLTCCIFSGKPTQFLLICLPGIITDNESTYGLEQWYLLQNNHFDIMYTRPDIWYHFFLQIINKIAKPVERNLTPFFSVNYLNVACS